MCSPAAEAALQKDGGGRDARRMEIGEGGGRGDGEASDLLLPIELEWIRQTSVPKVEETVESGPHLAVTMEPSFDGWVGPFPSLSGSTSIT